MSGVTSDAVTSDDVSPEASQKDIDSKDADSKYNVSLTVEDRGQEESSATVATPAIVANPDERPQSKSARPAKYAAPQTKPQNKFEDNSRTKPNQSACEQCSSAICAEALAGK
jgi:hypothetical protein